MKASAVLDLAVPDYAILQLDLVILMPFTFALGLDHRLLGRL